MVLRRGREGRRRNEEKNAQREKMSVIWRISYYNLRIYAVIFSKEMPLPVTRDVTA